MITAEEREHLDRIRAAEGDIYAEVMFLVLFRYPSKALGEWMAGTVRSIALVKPEPRLLAELIINAFSDLNERAEEPTPS